MLVMQERHDRLAVAGLKQSEGQVQRVDGAGLQPDLPLWQLVRASTAAPTYFPPEVIASGRRADATSSSSTAASRCTTTPRSSCS